MKYQLRIVSSLSEIGRLPWDALIATQDEANPFLSFAFFNALHESGSASAQTGWNPQFLTLWSDDHLKAAAPLYVKLHSYGEYVFDWAWAEAYERRGLEYYPKLLSAIPFTPVAGNRLIAANKEWRSLLVRELVELQERSDLSSTHILFPSEEEAQDLRSAGFFLRSGVQFHWHNPGYESFENFLDTLEQKKRKNIRAERRKVKDAGITFRHVPGTEATESDWKFFKLCYDHTYRTHYSTPYLNLDFFRRIGADMPQHVLLVIAERKGLPIASSLLIHDDHVLYGRYWGAIEYHPCLHFETAYYQPLEFCIRQGIACFEGGAQGEHKMARGFLPRKTWSAHWLRDQAFAQAVNRYLEQESGNIAHYVDELNEHSPFKKASLK